MNPLSYADIIVETRTPADRQIFTYLIPAELKILTGQIVLVPFGPRAIRGMILKIHQIPPKYKIRQISSATELILAPSYQKTIIWLSKYYHTSYGEALKLFLPPIIVRPPKNDILKPTKTNPLPILSKAQQDVYDNIILQIKSGINKHLIFGVTGSGKTEIYIKLLNDVLAVNGQSIILFPEIFLSSILLERLKKTFGHKIAIVHSKLSRGKVFDVYNRFNRGELSILVGPRSALSIPAKNLNLIIIDEEFDDSYKQEQSPRYDARKLAEKLAEFCHASLIYGTATPRVTTYHRTMNNDLSLHSLPDRYLQNLPMCEIIDLKKEFQQRNYSMLSNQLISAIDLTLNEKRKVLLFLNRRGFSSFVCCYDCGHTETCPSCNLPLIEHQQSGTRSLRCHQCSLEIASPPSCSQCKGQNIKSYGTGIQQIEKYIQDRFKNKIVVRFDSDLSPTELKNNQNMIESQKYDIIIGTQIIAKGLDLPKVDLVGIISADTSLNFPDYMAGERTFQLISQVAGRAGRHERQGKVIIQTIWPENEVIKAAARHDYESFYNNEIEIRQNQKYPPFYSLVRLVSSNKENNKARYKLDEAAKLLDTNDVEYIGPAPAFYARLREQYRYHLIIKFKESDRAKMMNILTKLDDDLTVDIDPTNML